MKLWRKLAKKDADGKRNGRQIAYQLRMQEMYGKTVAKSYPFLDALLKRAGVTYALTNKQQEILKQMIESQKEKLDETK